MEPSGTEADVLAQMVESLSPLLRGLICLVLVSLCLFLLNHSPFFYLAQASTFLKIFFIYVSSRLVKDNSANTDAVTGFIKNEFRGLSVEPCAVQLILLRTFA